MCPRTSSIRLNNKKILIRLAVYSFLLFVPHQLLSQQNVLEQRAKELFREGVELYNAGDYKSAVEKMRQAYEMKPLPPILYNIAVTYEKGGDLVLALEYYKIYLEKGARKTEIKEIQKKIEEIEKRLKAPVVMEEVEVKPPQMRAEPGNFSAAKRKSEETYIIIRAMPEQPAEALKIPWKWISLGAGSILIGTGTVFGIISRINYNDAENLSEKANPSMEDENKLKSLKTKVKWQSVTTDISLGLGLAAAAVSLYLFLTEESSSKQESLEKMMTENFILPEISTDFSGVKAVFLY
jgi:tetratricopeptide (TPR) repeat protein